MSIMYVESEYDMDQALAETIKLVKLKHTSLDLGFNNTEMVQIFLSNLHKELLENKITPEDKDFKLNIMVKTNEQT